MSRYLLFDAGCSVCNRLADTIDHAARGKLTTIDLRDERAHVLMNRAYPAGWRFAPYLVQDDGHQVRAWTGRGAALRLAWLLGPRKAWHVWSVAHQSGALGAQRHNARRDFFKIGAAMAAAMSTMLLFRQLPLAHAYLCGSCTQYQCESYSGYQCTDYCYPGIYCSYFIIHNCYDPCGEYCGYYTTFQTCNGCCG